MKNNNSLTKESFKGKEVSDFEPNNYEESRCKEIASELGELYINYLLSILRKQGYSVVERAWGLYKEAKANGKKITNHSAYFNGIVKKLTSEL